MRAIHTLLLNSRTCLNDEDYQTFIKFIRLTFDLGSVSVTEKAAAKLYVRIQQCLQGRVAASKLDSHEDRVL